MRKQNLAATATTGLCGGVFPFPLWNLGMPCATGVLASRDKLLMVCSTSNLGFVCLFSSLFLFFEVLVIVLKKILIASSMNSCDYSLDVLSHILVFPIF